LFELAESVVVDKRIGITNLLQFIQFTDPLCSNVVMEHDGRVVVTATIAKGAAIMLSRMPKYIQEQVCIIETERNNAQMYIDLFDNNNWMRMLTCSFPTSMTLFQFLPSAEQGTSTIYVDYMIAYKHKLIISCANGSAGLVASVIVDGILIYLPYGQSLLFPAYLPFTIQNIEGATVTTHLMSSISMNASDAILLTQRIKATFVPETHTLGSEKVSSLQYESICKPERTIKAEQHTQRKTREYRAPFNFILSLPQTDIDSGVRPRASSIPSSGTGLFTTKAFRKGDIVCSYGGKLLHRDEWDTLAKQEPESSNYGISVPQSNGSCTTYLVDGITHFGFTLGRFANEPDPHTKANVAPEWIDTSEATNKIPSGYIGMRAIKDIAASEEVLHKYGSGYPRNW
jgi:hypothetical protein